MTNPAERISEMDLARSGIISIQRDMPDKLTTWEVDYQVGNISYRVEAVARHGRPHGIDNDVILYLQSLFLRAGCPDHNRVTTTANQLLLNAIGSNSKKEYERLAKALLRLAGTSWTMYRDAPDKRTGKVKGLTTTNYMFTLEMEDWVDADAQTKRGLVSSSKIVVRFADEFAHSIRMGFFQLLDHDLLERLGHTNARSLYRVIQGHRVQPDGSLAFELFMPLADWLAACGLEAERLDNAKRILDAAHKRMLETNYLRNVELQGRGAAGSIYYSFSGLPEPQLVEMLMTHKVTRPVAEALASQYPKRIIFALKVVDERLTTGWRPRSLAGAVVDAVRNPEKWGYVPPDSTQVKEKATASKKPKEHKGHIETLENLEDISQPSVKEVVLSFLRVRLGRPPSLYALAAIDELADDQLQHLKELLMKPAEVSLPLATELLGGTIL